MLKEKKMATVKITIDGKEVEVEQGSLLIEAAKKHGTEIPHYCYHPGLTPHGNCRMCLVKVEKIPKPVIACQTPVNEGMVIDTASEEVQTIRQQVMEFLLINHPLDCPTCDQAGECRLQDYYMEYDVKASRFQEEKNHKDKMVNLGSGVMLDEERCIVCTRCVRFCDEIAKSPELYMQERGDHSMVANFPGKELSNPYSGNVVDVCPVGALTSKDFRYKKRVWYLNRNNSICPGCSRGCNIEIHHEEKKVYRLKPRHNPEVNDYWMCDEGRYGYKFINEKRRLKPTYRYAGEFEEATLEDSLRHLDSVLCEYDPDEIAFIASAQESNEEIDAFYRLADEIFDVNEVYYSFNNPAEKYSDEILISDDKNANSSHIKKLGLKAVSEIPASAKAVVVQRDLNSEDLKAIKEKGLEVVLLFSVNETDLDEMAHVIFPIPSFAEQEGHFTNQNGLIQKFDKAFDPRGEAKQVLQYLPYLENTVLKMKKAG